MPIRPAEVDLDVPMEIVEKDPELIIQIKTYTLKVYLCTILSGLRELKNNLKFERWVSRAHSNHDIDPCVHHALSWLLFHVKSFDWRDPVVSDRENCALQNNHELDTRRVNAAEKASETLNMDFH